MAALASEEMAGGIARIVLTGAMDLAGTEAIGLRLGVLAASRSALVLDLEGVTFLSSNGVRALVTAAITMSRHGGRMALINPSPEVGKVLITTGCDQLLPVFPDLAAALAVFAR